MQSKKIDLVAIKLLYDTVGKNLNLEQEILNAAYDIYQKGMQKEQLKIAIKANPKLLPYPLIAGALYAAARKYQSAITLDEISSFFKIKKIDLAKSYRLFSIALKIKVRSGFPLGQLLYVLRKIENKHVLSEETYKASEEVLKKLNSTAFKINDWGPVIAAVIFIEFKKFKEHVSLEEISDASGISKDKILRTAKELLSIN